MFKINTSLNIKGCYNAIFHGLLSVINFTKTPGLRLAHNVYAKRRPSLQQYIFQLAVAPVDLVAGQVKPRWAPAFRNQYAAVQGGY